MGHRRRRWNGCLRVFLFGGKLSCLDPAVTLAGDVDGQRRMLEAITDSVCDDGITVSTPQSASLRE
jgi:hypothetical protein